MTDLDEPVTGVLADPRPLTQDARSALFHDARTANTFSSREVSDETLREIWDMARWPPTSANLQPLRVLYVRTQAGKDRLVPLMSEGNREKTSRAPVIAVLAEDSRFHEYVPTVMPFRPEMQGVLDANEPMRAHLGAFSSSLQAGYFILAVRAAGLAIGPMGGFDAAGVDAEFFPDGRWHAKLVVNIGYPGADAYRPRQARLDPGDVLRWE